MFSIPDTVKLVIDFLTTSSTTSSNIFWYFFIESISLILFFNKWLKIFLEKGKYLT